MGDGLSFLQVEFQGVQAFRLTLLQSFNDAGRLGRTHGIDQERRRAMVNEVQDGFGRYIGVGNDKLRTIDVADACL